MGLLITSDDFIGRYELAKSNDDLIDDYIAEFEEKYLIDLLGQDLFNLFKADIVNYVPVTDIYINIFNQFSKQIDVCIYTSSGMKKMVLGFVYYHYVKDSAIKQTMNGAVTQQTEVSTPALNTFIYSRYNQSVNNYRSIQVYINNDLIQYPTFLGTYKRFASII